MTPYSNKNFKKPLVSFQRYMKSVLIKLDFYSLREALDLCEALAPCENQTKIGFDRVDFFIFKKLKSHICM